MKKEKNSNALGAPGKFSEVATALRLLPLKAGKESARLGTFTKNCRFCPQKAVSGVYMSI